MMDAQRVADVMEIHELCARYMMLCSQFIDDRWLEVFTPDAEYNAFGTAYDLAVPGVARGRATRAVHRQPAGGRVRR